MPNAVKAYPLHPGRLLHRYAFTGNRDHPIQAPEHRHIGRLVLPLDLGPRPATTRCTRIAHALGICAYKRPQLIMRLRAEDCLHRCILSRRDAEKKALGDAISRAVYQQDDDKQDAGQSLSPRGTRKTLKSTILGIRSILKASSIMPASLILGKFPSPAGKAPASYRKPLFCRNFPLNDGEPLLRNADFGQLSVSMTSHIFAVDSII